MGGRPERLQVGQRSREAAVALDHLRTFGLAAVRFVGSSEQMSSCMASSPVAHALLFN